MTNLLYSSYGYNDDSLAEALGISIALLIIILIVALIICFVLAHIAGNIASNKGYSYWGFWLLGLLLGVVGIIIAAVVPLIAVL